MYCNRSNDLTTEEYFDWQPSTGTGRSYNRLQYWRNRQWSVRTWGSVETRQTWYQCVEQIQGFLQEVLKLDDLVGSLAMGADGGYMLSEEQRQEIYATLVFLHAVVEERVK